MAGTNTMKDSESNIICGLGDYTHTCTNTSLYKVSVKLSEVPTSSISIVIKQNSTTIATSTALTTAQSHKDLSAILNCAATDVIHVILTSSAAIDNQLNGVSTLVTIDRLN